MWYRNWVLGYEPAGMNDFCVETHKMQLLQILAAVYMGTKDRIPIGPYPIPTNEQPACDWGTWKPDTILVL